MAAEETVTPDAIRAMFASALSEMYRKEVPQYGTLLRLVSEINHQNYQHLEQRFEVERHGAIRLGTASELAMIRRLFSVMGMQPVGYYDLSIANLPVHATCFRPTTEESLAYNPFRVFTSLLRLDLIQDQALRSQAAEVLSKRNIFTSRCIELIDLLEKDLGGRVRRSTAEEFVKEALETFRWHKISTVDMKTYRALQAQHPLVADVVCFKGPHINHLTPRVIDIEAAQNGMLRCGLYAKDTIEGPPLRRCPILLRQTSFLALDEAISFSNGEETGGSHKARFGEIEQRGMALTRKGRQLYDDLIQEWRTGSSKSASHSEGAGNETFSKIFERFPDDIESLSAQGLAYFKYKPTDRLSEVSHPSTLESLVNSGAIELEPITYEDFLPISAAGIFQSNLGADAAMEQEAKADRTSFERALGSSVHDEFQLYTDMQNASIQECWKLLPKV